MLTYIMAHYTVTEMPERRLQYKMEKADFKFSIECLPENCANCKHGLSLSRRIYCSVLKDKIDDIFPEHCPCPFFEPEPLEYKLFRRA